MTNPHAPSQPGSWPYDESNDLANGPARTASAVNANGVGRRPADENEEGLQP
jgi:hypothetical protein